MAAYPGRYGELWEASRAASQSHDLLTWPDFPIRYVPQPMWARQAAPYLYFLFYRAPAAFNRPPIHDYLITPIEASLPRPTSRRCCGPTTIASSRPTTWCTTSGLGHHVQNWHAYRAGSRIGQVAAVDCAARIAMFWRGHHGQGWAVYATSLIHEAGFLTPLEHYSEFQSRRRFCVFVQDGSAAITPSDFTGWEILNNSFKPYAACHLTHPAVDAAREMAPGANALAGLRMVKAEIGLLADQVTGRRSGAPTTGLEGKFDIKYCVALGLHGRTLSAADFAEPWSADPAVLATAGKVTVVADPAIAYTEARVALEYADGRSDARHIPIGKGHPGNSMGWDDMAVKFDALVRPRLGARGEALFGLVRAFGSGGVLAEIREIVGRV